MNEILNILIRAVSAYITLLILTRFMGKREISQLTFFDYTVGITLGSITASMALDTSRPFTTILPALLVFCTFQITISFISLKSKSIRKLVEGTSTMIIKDGKILESNLLKERFNIDELSGKLREKNVFSLADVEFAFLETDGKISVMKKANKQPVTPYDLKIPTEYSGIGGYVVEEGKIITQKLREYGLTTSWLMSKVGEQGIYDISKIMLAQVDNSGKLYIDLYDDNNNINKNTSEEILLSKINKIQSDFYSYYNDTTNEDYKKLYRECSDRIKHISVKYNSYLKENKARNITIENQDIKFQ